MKGKLKRVIIHLIGGYTTEEVKERETESFVNGMKHLKVYLDCLNGTPADEWCKLAYERVCKMTVKPSEHDNIGKNKR